MTPWDLVTTADVPAGVQAVALLQSDQGPLTSLAALAEAAQVVSGAFTWDGPATVDPAGCLAVRAGRATFQPAAQGVTVSVQGFALLDMTGGGVLLATAWLASAATLSPDTGPLVVAGPVVVTRKP